MKFNDKINGSFKTTSAAVFALASTLACGAEDPAGQVDAETVGHSAEPITGGDLVTSATAPWSSIVKMGGCSGLKVGSNWYLTAWHCGFQPNTSVTVTNSLSGSGGTTHTIAQVVNHPTTLVLAGNNLGYDLAMIELSGTNSIPFLTPAYTAQPPSPGIALGYGCDSIDPTHAGKKQFGNMTTVNHPWPGANTYAFWSNSIDPRLCPGDSGGPFVRLVDSTWMLSGVNSFQTGDVSPTGSGFARTYPAREWIEAVRAGLPGKNDFSNSNTGTFLNWWSNYCFFTNHNGNPAELMECRMAADSSYRFRAEPGGGAFFQFRNSFSNGCLAIVGGSTAEGAVVTSRPCDNSDTTKWAIQGTGDFRQIRNKKSGKCIQVDSPGVGSVVSQRTCQNTTDFFWLFSD
jgi:hypothetical protein